MPRDLAIETVTGLTPLTITLPLYSNPQTLDTQPPNRAPNHLAAIDYRFELSDSRPRQQRLVRRA
jgi:hypothetical protein